VVLCAILAAGLIDGFRGMGPGLRQDDSGEAAMPLALIAAARAAPNIFSDNGWR
jgi:hypothetical protein